MKKIQVNKKSLLRSLMVVSVFAVSLLNLSVEFQRDPDGGIDLTSLSITSQKARAEVIVCHLVSSNVCYSNWNYDYICNCYKRFEVQGMAIVHR